MMIAGCIPLGFVVAILMDFGWEVVNHNGLEYYRLRMSTEAGQIVTGTQETWIGIYSSNTPMRCALKILRLLPPSTPA